MGSTVGFEEVELAVRNFEFCIIDGTKYLRDSYRLRYEVYCHERNFLHAEDYPSRLEIDHFDAHAIHMGAINPDGELVGTLRLILPSKLGLPLLEHCALFNDDTHLASPAYASSAEISRLAVFRSGNNATTDSHNNTVNTDCALSLAQSNTKSLRDKLFITLGLYQVMYHTSKIRGITHWFASMEKSLWRMLNFQGIQFKAIGPEVDYYGPVSPYLANIADLEAYVKANNVDLW
jgi:N-acyl amino acid synthase of PEP-CTERM/exosortase system